MTARTRNSHFIWIAALGWLAGTGLAAARAADPRVDLEIALEANPVGADMRAWSEMLSQAGFSSVRVRTAGKDSPALQKSGPAAAPAFHVVGVLTADNQLLLPKGRFALRDRAAIEQWLRKLRDDGEDGISIKPSAFGLLPKQLVAVHEALEAPVNFSTLGKQPREVARQIAQRLTLKFTTDPAGQRALAADEPVLDELQGLSSGTALAAVLRPVGLVLVPEKSGGDLRLRIADGRTAPEHWPVGWPLKERTPAETLPDLFKFLNVEIAQTPLAEALAAIGSRVKAPLLIDRNAVAKESIDLHAKVTLPKANTFYAKALDRLLSQARLKYELRIDEADHPFLWITATRAP